jgi:hypothetical protein
MSQEIINIGASANDGQGDPIRTAFAKTNNNFTQLFGIGASQIIYNGTSNVNLPFLNGNVFISVAGVSNVMVVDSGGANIAGTLAVTGNITGGNLRTAGAISSAGTITGVTVVGDYIQGIVTTPTQTQITSLGTLTSLSVSGNVNPGNLTTTGIVSAAGAILAGGNVTGGNLRTAGLISATGSVTAGNIFGGGLISAAGNITGANMLANGSMSITGDLTVNGNATLSGNILGDRIQNGTTSFDIQTQNGNANITVGGTSNVVVFANTGVYANGVVSTTGNVTGNYIFGNGSQLTGLAATYGNANVVANLAALGSNPVSTTGNITGNVFIGNGSQLTNLPVPAVAQDITTTGDMSIMTYDGNLKYVSYATIEPASGNLKTAGSISASGNITANNIGNIVSINLNGNASTVLYGNGTFAPVAGGSSYGDSNVTTLLSNLGSNTISGTANVTGGNLLTSGLISVTGNVDAGNLRTTGTISATGLIYSAANVFGINLKTSGLISATGNTTSGNILTGGIVSATGNVFGNFFIGNGSALTGITASANTGNVTFNNQAVVGTGDQVGSSGLYLAPGTESVANLQYIRVRGGDVATHIHLDTGNNAYFDQYFGDDGKYVKLANTGDVVISSDDATGNSAQWTFDTTGNLTLPDAGGVGTVFGYTALKAGNTGALVYQDVTTFMGVDNHGSITLTANNSSWVLGNATNDGNAVMLLPGGYQIYQPGVAILSIEAPANTSGVSLNYLGGTSLTVGNISNVNVVTVTNTGNSWTFKADGVIQCPLVSVDDLPLATTPGQRAMVYDASNPPISFGNIVGNAGSNVLPVFSDGTNWRVG